MDKTIDELYQKFRAQGLIQKTAVIHTSIVGNPVQYYISHKIDPEFNLYTKEKAVAVILKWIRDGRDR